MAKSIISPKAEKNLKRIGTYTEKQWGRRQRIKYLAQLESRIHDLAHYPTKGRIRHDLPEKPFSYREGRHVIFYRTTPEGIEVIRVLHDSMDFPRHFR